MKKQTINNEFALPDVLSFAPDEILPAPKEKPNTSSPSLAKTPYQVNAWEPRLIIDLALEIDPLEEILVRYNLSMEEYNALSSVPSFRRELANTIREVRENGISFTKKAAVQAESYLEVLDTIVNDALTPPSVRLEAIRSTVEWGKLNPKEPKGDNATNATQINVNISF